MQTQEVLDLIPLALTKPNLLGEIPSFNPPEAHKFLSELATKMNARVFLELGTGAGWCSRHIAMKNPGTTIVTIDRSKLPEIAAIEQANPNFRFVQGEAKELAVTIGPEYNGLIDILFIDTATLDQLDDWKPYLAKPCMVIIGGGWRDRVFEQIVETILQAGGGTKIPFSQPLEIGILQIE